MKRVMIAAMIASTLMAGLAAANPPAAKAKGAEGEAQNSGRSMDAPYLAVPVVRDGQLVNYLFVSVRFEIAPGVDLWRTREQAHFLRDALVRASHANALARADDVNALNEARAIAVFQATASQVLGPRAISRVSIVSSYSSRGSGT
jgi:hypothetical protein